MKKMKTHLLLGWLCLLVIGMAHAQVPQITRNLIPSDYFVNEEFCFTLDLEETANTGFGPYLRIMLPPGVNLSSATFTGNSTLTLVDTSTGTWMKDPHRNSGTVGDSVLLPPGWTFYILDYPVGSVTAGGVALTTRICLIMDPAIVTIGVPLDIQFQGGYIYGNTPTGSNGPTLGPLWTGQVTPLLYLYGKTSAPLPRHDRTPGPDWPLLYSLTVDIANAQTVTGLIFQDDLPDSLMYVPGSLTAPVGCSMNTSGLVPGVPGGSFTVTCPSGVGTLGDTDVLVQYAGYALNVLDEGIGGGPCDMYKIVNVSTLTTDQGGPITSVDTVKIYNLTLQQVSTPGTIVPGGTVTTTIKIQVSDYISAMDSFELVIRVADGLDFVGNSMLDGVPVSPVSVLTNYPTVGATWVVYDMVALRGGVILPGDSLKLTYETVVRQNYQATGAQVLARDELSTYADAHYHLADELPGVLGCDYHYKAIVVVIPNQISKEVIGGSVYVPGDMVTYRLRMILPSGDANSVVFTDFFPIPIHNVANIDTTWGGPNIVPGPNHYAAAVPTNISILPANNGLVIDFGDVASLASPETLEVYLSVPVTTVPFANGLIHSNFLEVISDNTQLTTLGNLELTQVWIGAPMLSLVKGVAAVQNPNAWLTAPGSYPINSDGINVDANDTIQFVSTITNIGGAQAFNIQVVDPMPMHFVGCQVRSVTNGSGNAIPYTGDLFGPTDTLVIDSMAASGPDSVAYIAYDCEVFSNALPWEKITNRMSVAWASAIGQDSLFDRISDTAFVRVAPPATAKNIVAITPGHAQNLLRAHVGEVITYVATITVPEGESDSVVLRDLMGPGLAFAGVDSIVSSSIDVSSSLGPISAIVPAVDSAGIGLATRDRSVVFDFDTLWNKNAENNIPETIQIYYKARVLNVTTNLRGANLTNDIHLAWRTVNGQVQNVYNAAPVVQVVEAGLTLTKEFMTPTVSPNDSVFVTFTLQHDPLSNGTAYDVLVTDTLPFGMVFVPNSFSGACPSSFTIAPGFAGGVVSATWDSLELGTSCQMRFKLSVDNAFPACNDIVNEGDLFWESVSDPLQAALPNCPTNPYGVERTGFANAPGQVNDYVVRSADTLHVGVTFPSLPQLSSNGPVCIGNQLELTCTPLLGANVQYIWTTPQGPDTTLVPQLIRYPVTAADSGYYAVTLSLGGCLSPSSTQLLVQVTANPVVLATGDGTFCAGQDAQLTAVAYPAGNYNYSWTGPNGFISNSQNPLLSNLTALMAGNYTVQVSGGGCTSVWALPVNIQVLARPEVAVMGDTLTCSHGLVDVIVQATPVSGTGPFTYYWTGPGGFASTMEDAIIPNAMNAHQGNYIVTMTDSFGCASLPMTAIVDILDAPATPVITQQGALCPGDALTLVTTAYTGASVSYLWTTPTGPVTTSVPSLNIPAVTTNDAGLYAVVVEIDGCQTLMSAWSTVVVDAAPIAPSPTATYGDPLNCAGDTLWLTAQGDSAHTYLWTGPNGFTGSGATVFVPNAGPDYNGSYEVTVSNGNCTVVASVTINSILPYPATPSLVQPLVVCEGANVILQANPYNGTVVDYLWATPNGMVTTTTPSLLLQPVALGDSGNYALMVTVNGCSSLVSGTVALEVNPTPATPVILTNQTTYCEGDTVVLGTPNFPGATYNWSGPAGYASTQQNPPIIAGATTIHTGVFELFVVFDGCRSAIAHDTIVVQSRPTAPMLFAPNASLCDGDPIVLTSNGSCNSHYWVGPQGFSAAVLGNPSQNTTVATTTIYATDSAYLAGAWTTICVATNGCASIPSAPVHITIAPRPLAPTVTNPGPQCAGTTLTLVATSNAVGGTYLWTGPNGFAYQGQSPTLSNITLAHAGDYGVVVSSNGCTSDTTWTTVVIDTVPAMPNPTVTGPVCAGSSLILEANVTASAYLWTGPSGFTSTQQNPVITGLTTANSGYYQLVVAQNACSSGTALVNVTVVDNNDVPALNANGPLCEGETLSLSAAPVAGSNVAYVWTCPGPMVDTTLVPALSAAATTTAYTGWYSLNVLVDGCPSPNSAPVYVEVHPRPAAPTITSNGPVCEGGNIVLATTAQADSYLWRGPNSFVSTQQQPSVITGAQAYHGGTYSLSVTQDGCQSADASTLVVVTVAGPAPTLQSNSPVCTGDTIVIVASSGANQYLWTSPGGATTTTAGPILVLAPADATHNGQYTVQGLVAGCATAQSAPIMVSVSDVIQENAFAGDDRLVCNGDGTTMLQAGNTTAAGLWTTNSNATIVSPGQAHTLVTNLEPGIDYVFHWTLQAVGCLSTSNDSVHVSVAQSPLANPNGYSLKDYAELVNAGILLDDSLWLQDVNLSVVYEPQHGTWTTNPNQTLNYLPERTFVGQDSLLYEVCLKACPEMCDRAWVQFVINPLIVIPDLITPNGDGVNDAFEMIGLENYPHNQLMIYNRWGNEVFLTDDYQNDWAGTYNGQPVPDGTYFWVLLDTGDGSEIMRGYLTVHR
jgi:gliding motility-associated-like protein/uncharacterized repeat protein (TIGR01451 family)